MSEAIVMGLLRGVPKLQRPIAAARSASSSPSSSSPSASPVSAVEGRVSTLDWRKWENAGEYSGALPVKELDGKDWNERWRRLGSECVVPILELGERESIEDDLSCPIHINLRS